MWTANALAILAALSYYDDDHTASFVDLSGTTIRAGGGGAANDYINGTIVVRAGSGTTPPTVADYKLEEEINGLSYACDSKSINSSATSNFDFIAIGSTVATNTTNHPVTITELIWRSYYGNHYICLAREVIEPIVLQPGEATVLNMKFGSDKIFSYNLYSGIGAIFSLGWWTYRSKDGTTYSSQSAASSTKDAIYQHRRGVAVNSRIFVGSGTKIPDALDLWLDNELTDISYSGATTTLKYSRDDIINSGGYFLSKSILVTNTSSETKNINEIALCNSAMYILSNKTVPVFFCREVLDEPIILEPGESVSLSMSLRV